MENLENNVPAPGADIPEENGTVIEPVIAGAGIQEIPDAPKPPVKEKKASPFADSPYVVQSAPEKPKAAPKSKKKGGKVWKKILCSVAAIAVLVGACGITAAVVEERYEGRLARLEETFENRLEALEEELDKVGQGSVPSGKPIISGSALTPAQVYAMNFRSVVLIHNVVSANGQTGSSTGSGFILSSDGYVVTNHHVIEGNGALTVITADGKQYSAKLIGSDNANDIALLKMDATGLPSVTLGDSDDLIVGDQVAAIGNPLGELTSTLTVGYISAMERDVNTSGFAINMIQTDAAINSGNSGGPLFNMKGEVIGITTAKYSGSSSSGASIEGIGFAIPINDVRDLLEDLTANGRSTAPYLGVSVSDVDAAYADYFGMPVGARVGEVVKGSCAERSGLQVKDIIVKFGSYDVENVNDLTRALRKYKAGDKVDMVVYRGGGKLTLTVVLDERPDNIEAQPSQPPQEIPETLPQEGMPSEGDWEEWFNYLFPFFSGGNNG